MCFIFFLTKHPFITLPKKPLFGRNPFFPQTSPLLKIKPKLMKQLFNKRNHPLRPLEFDQKSI